MVYYKYSKEIKQKDDVNEKNEKSTNRATKHSRCLWK